MREPTITILVVAALALTGLQAVMTDTGAANGCNGTAGDGCCDPSPNDALLDEILLDCSRPVRDVVYRILP